VSHRAPVSYPSARRRTWPNPRRRGS